MDVTPQLADLALKIGEPTDVAQQRFTQTQLLAVLNEARAIVAEETKCFPVTDTQVVVPPTSVFSVTNDFIGFYSVEYGGRPMRLVRTDHWRDVVGDDDTVSGDPAVCRYHARQIQLFPRPRTGGLSLTYYGWAYPTDLVLLGIETAFTEAAARAARWEAAAILKGLDERGNEFETKMAMSEKAKIAKQYDQKGPRYVKTGDLYLPWRPLP